MIVEPDSSSASNLAKDSSLWLKFKPVFSSLEVFHVLITYLLAFAFFVLLIPLRVLCISSSFPPMSKCFWLS